jgi:lipopolysaccharide/colanic/teichoic acid biosynthesis glycosyltransferase
MSKRGFDIIFALTVLALTSPLMLVGMAVVRLSSPGTIFYVAARAGRDSVPFAMLKLRTMHEGSAHASPITGPNDTRIFIAGRILRVTKIDELPQFINVLRGDLSVVGPRPEDPSIVEMLYTPWMKETLAVRPGITSPGAIFGYLNEKMLLDPDDPEGSYATKLLPIKLAVERVYLDRATFLSDLGVIGKTALAIVIRVTGVSVPLIARDIRNARTFLAQKET